MKVPWFTMYYNWSARILKCLHSAVAVYFKYGHLCTSAEKHRKPTWWREELSQGGKTRTKFDSTIQPDGVYGAQTTSRDSLHLFTSLFSRQTESFEVTGWEISLALQAPQKKGENVTGSFTKKEKSHDFPPVTSATVAGVTLDRVSCTPLCLDVSARSDASPWTLSLVRTTQTPPPPPPPHLLSLPSSVWHLPIPDLSPIPSRVLLLLPCPPLSSSSCCSLLHSRRTRLLSYSTPPLSPPLSLFSSPTSAARFLTFLHFHTLWLSISNTYAAGYSRTYTCP